jgi:hypothetical protein
MKKQKTPDFEWFVRSGCGPLQCENGEIILSIYTYGGTPLISCHILIAYLDIPKEAVWENGKKISERGAGWRYAANLFVGGGWNSISVAGKDGPILANSPTFATRIDAIKAALNELLEGCDKWLLTPSNSSRPYWGKSQGRYFSQPGREQLAYYLCMPEMEPFYQLIETYSAHDKWLEEVRAPKKSSFVEQLDLF